MKLPYVVLLRCIGYIGGLSFISIKWKTSVDSEPEPEPEQFSSQEAPKACKL